MGSLSGQERRVDFAFVPSGDILDGRRMFFQIRSTPHRRAQSVARLVTTIMFPRVLADFHE